MSREEVTLLSIREPYPSPLMALSQLYGDVGFVKNPRRLYPCEGGERPLLSDLVQNPSYMAFHVGAGTAKPRPPPAWSLPLFLARPHSQLAGTGGGMPWIGGIKGEAMRPRPRPVSVI